MSYSVSSRNMETSSSVSSSMAARRGATRIAASGVVLSLFCAGGASAQFAMNIDPSDLAQMFGGGMGMMMGGGGRRRQELEWPAGVTKSVSKDFEW